jgi:mannose-6-phosphate isomerase-like protein (cupin superfamily)
MPVIRRADAPVFTLPEGGTKFTGLAAPSRGAKETSAWQVSWSAHQDGTPHFLDHEEVFVLLAGRAVFSIGEDEFEAAAGDAVIVPAHTRLSVANPFDEPVDAIAILPAGAQGRMSEDGEPFTPPWAA